MAFVITAVCDRCGTYAPAPDHEAPPGWLPLQASDAVRLLCAGCAEERADAHRNTSTEGLEALQHWESGR